LNFRTTKSDFITGDEITDSKEIAINYLKGRFIIDLIAAIPMDIILAGNQVLDSDYMDSSHPSSSSAAHRILGGSAAGASSTISPTITTSKTGTLLGPVQPNITIEIVNILSILKVLRILRFTKIITFLNTSESVKLSLRLFKLIFYLILYIHWQACAWFYYTK
jgi:hypothetical protein